MIETDHSARSVAAQLDALPCPIALLRHMAGLRPMHPALIFMGGADDMSPRVVTYGELLTQTEGAIAAFQAAGITKDDAVAIVTPTCPEGVAALIAASAAGIAFPVNTLLSSEALAAQFNLAGVKAAVILGPHPGLDIFDRVMMATAAVPALHTIVTISPDMSSAADCDWHAFVKRAQAPISADTNADTDRVAALFHTGGTTGAPKLAELSLKNLAAGALMSAAAVKWRADDRALCALPLFHVAGAIDAGIGALTAGATLIFPGWLGGRDPGVIANIWTLVDRLDATILGLMPTSFAAAVDAPFGPKRPHTLRALLTGGSALSPHLAKRLESLTGCPFAQVYGMTEAAGIVTAQPADGVFREPAVGYAPPLVDLRVGETGASSRGEVFVRGPNIFRGYRTPTGRLPAPDDWVASGDLGEVLPDGQLRLIGRTKDVIIRGGHNIDPVLIEDVALSHADVRQAAAVGMPDAYAGELPVLYVMLRDDAALTIEQLGEYLAQRIAEPPARPKRIFVLPQLPLTPLGKVARFRLRQSAAELSAQEALAPFPTVSVVCADTNARCITVTWFENVTLDERQRAAIVLNERGLTLSAP